MAGDDEPPGRGELVPGELGPPLVCEVCGTGMVPGVAVCSNCGTPNLRRTAVAPRSQVGPTLGGVAAALFASSLLPGIAIAISNDNYAVGAGVWIAQIIGLIVLFARTAVGTGWNAFARGALITLACVVILIVVVVGGVLLVCYLAATNGKP